MRIRPRLLACCLLALLPVSGLCGAASRAHPAEIRYARNGSTTLGAPDKWDYVLFDPSSGRVFVAQW